LSSRIRGVKVSADIDTVAPAMKPGPHGRIIPIREASTRGWAIFTYSRLLGVVAWPGRRWTRITATDATSAKADMAYAMATRRQGENRAVVGPLDASSRTVPAAVGRPGRPAACQPSSNGS